MAYGTTNMGGKFYISDTVENDDLTESEFNALTYIEVPNMGTMGDTGITQNLPTYSTWGNQVVAKGKGEADAGSPDVEFLDLASAGIDAMNDAAVFDNQDNYAFKVEWPDGVIEYNRGLVTGPSRPKGGNEDFRRVSYSLGMQQAPVLSEASSST